MANLIIHELISDIIQPIISDLIVSDDTPPPGQSIIFVAENESHVFVSEDESYVFVLE